MNELSFAALEGAGKLSEMQTSRHRILGWLGLRLGLVVVGTAAAISILIKLPDTRSVSQVHELGPKEDYITIRTPLGRRVIEAKSISFGELWQKFIPVGKERTKVTVVSHFDEYWENGQGKLVVEITPDSVLPDDPEVLELYQGWKIPSGSIVSVTFDEEPDSVSFFRKGIDDEWSYRYRFDKWEGQFSLPPGSRSASDGVVFNSRVVWACEKKEEDGYYREATYILESSVTELARLTAELREHSAPRWGSSSTWREMVRFGVAPEERSSRIRRKHSLSDSTEIESWRRGDEDWVIGIDHEQGRVYWNWSDDS